MNFPIEHDGRSYPSVSASEARELGVADYAIDSALKGLARDEVAQFANIYRARIASTSAGKLAAYRIKEEIAGDPDGASPAEIALIEREANARGMSRDDLIARILVQASSYRQIALLIEVLEVEVGAAIAAISGENPNIESQIQKVLEAAKVQADLAFEEALTLLAV
jgi:hypothetical protein